MVPATTNTKEPGRDDLRNITPDASGDRDPGGFMRWELFVDVHMLVQTQPGLRVGHAVTVPIDRVDGEAQDQLNGQTLDDITRLVEREGRQQWLQRMLGDDLPDDAQILGYHAIRWQGEPYPFEHGVLYATDIHNSATLPPCDEAYYAVHRGPHLGNGIYYGYAVPEVDITHALGSVGDGWSQHNICMDASDSHAWLHQAFRTVGCGYSSTLALDETCSSSDQALLATGHVECYHRNDWNYPLSEWKFLRATQEASVDIGEGERVYRGLLGALSGTVYPDRLRKTALAVMGHAVEGGA